MNPMTRRAAAGFRRTETPAISASPAVGARSVARIRNVVVWPAVFDAYATLAKTSPLLGVTGRLQVQQGVMHVIAEELWTPRVGAHPADIRSRDSP